MNVIYGSVNGLTTTGNQFWTEENPGIPLLIDEIETAIDPVFESVTFCAVLVVPTTCFGKFNDARCQ